MRTSAKIAAVLLVLAGVSSAFAEDSPLQGIREMCLERAGSSWTDFNPLAGHGRARTNIYSSCMVDHGLRP